MTELEYSFQGPKRGADRAVLLAHGAGSDMEAPALTIVADALAHTGVPSLRFNFPYRVRGRKAPDRAPVLEVAVREAVDELCERTGLGRERLVLGGRSMGGRHCSMITGHADEPVPALGLLLLGYPLHPAGKPEKLRVEHFPRLDVPVLFVSGTRDALAPRAALEREAEAIRGPASFHWLDTADHGFRPLKRSGRTQEETLAESASASVEWIGALPGMTPA